MIVDELHRRHRSSEFLRFLRTIDVNVPADLDVGNFDLRQSAAAAAAHNQHVSAAFAGCVRILEARITHFGLRDRFEKR
ncbi:MULTISPECIES: hypothetical protein [Burkholderia]|uniref:hypothetical protein n=1 Tax=Burkholderia TaxID=32008 RepID=UPI00059F31DD|nr:MULTISPECIES: hypothetical protein [Burkholderia]MCA8088305.1 hypothetical protein [Burkholderia cenocepacia]MCA8464187.1 hypothetical protein [Burkholderia multivorans]OXI79956.1 hypothetical protein CFB50_32760 [Burkholderia sp. AU33423]PRF99642.1 hypothetical protein C6Q21_26490 [Burkholderia multivorans]